MTARAIACQSRLQRHLLAGVFTAGIVLRFLLALYNREANDDHMEVVRRIADLGQNPLVFDCWQCCQAKLFHQTAAFVINLFELTDPAARIVAVQMINVVAGTLTLVVLWWMATKLTSDAGIRLACFSLIALNPKFIGINAQATNDSFVILFGVTSIYAFWRFLTELDAGRGALTIVALVLASISKAQGLALFAMVVTIYAVKAACERSDRGRRRSYLVALAATVVLYLSSVPFLGPYYDHYVVAGSPLAWNTPKAEPPKLFEFTKVERPGVRSVADAYFTFRFFDLLREPYIRGVFYSPHRTSLWSQLYARSQFVQYDSWPDSWRTRDPFILNTGRVLLVLGLVPLALGVFGVAREFLTLGRGILSRGRDWLASDNRWVLLVLTGGVLFIVVKFSYDLRDFSSMKAIYVFPGLGCFMAMLTSGLSGVLGGRGAGLLRRPLYASLAVLVLLYCADVSLLIGQLG